MRRGRGDRVSKNKWWCDYCQEWHKDMRKYKGEYGTHCSKWLYYNKEEE